MKTVDMRIRTLHRAPIRIHIRIRNHIRIPTRMALKQATNTLTI